MVSRQFVNSRLTIRVLLFFRTVWTVYLIQPIPENDSFLFNIFFVKREKIEKTVFIESPFCMLTHLDRFNAILQYYHFISAIDFLGCCGISTASDMERFDSKIDFVEFTL